MAARCANHGPIIDQYNQTPMTTKSKQIIKRGIAGFAMNGKKLSQEQVIAALITRVDSLEADQFAHIGALHALGAGRCDTTGQWMIESQLIRAGDRCQSIKAFDPDHFFSEFDDEDQGFKNLVEIFREINRRGLHSVFSKMPRDPNGILVEPYRSACLAAIPRSMSK
jgi:hypothetical protein